MKIAVLRERRPGEKRVAATPETVKKMIGLGAKVVIEKGAGVTSSYFDEEYQAAGASLAKDATSAIDGADLILKVQRPLLKGEQSDNDDIESAKKGVQVIALFSPHNHAKDLKFYAKHELTTSALELVPRITRAQSMDVLSSQSNLAGYRAVIEAAYVYDKAYPMMMTAAGTIAPAKILILGAGVAGLQAIATAKRLGAVVSAFDVRAAAKEQVESLGATFVSVESDEIGEGTGGYAKEMSADYKKRQSDKIKETLAKSDIAISTALIPGKPAPKLITEDMIKGMKPGSVVLDMAVESGGNCDISEAGKVVEKYGVQIIGYINLPSRIARDASALYARNVFHFVNLLFDKEKKGINLNFEDEIISATTLTYGGEVIHPQFKTTKGGKE